MITIIDNGMGNRKELKRDREHVLKKFGWTDEEFEELMNLEVKNHQNHKTDLWLRKFLSYFR